MKKLLICILLLHSTITHAQSGMAGKKFTACVGETCKDKIDGGCTIKYYCSLSFKIDSVTVHNYVKAYCTNKEENAGYEKTIRETKTYKYTVNDPVIIVEGFDRYGTYREKDNLLIGEKGRQLQIIFEPDKN